MNASMRVRSKKVLRALTAGIPFAILAASSFFPIKPAVSQVLVGLALIWFQVSLMLGVWS